jgi:hypothetical protein
MSSWCDQAQGENVMSEPIGPGDWVECIQSYGDPQIRVGSVYCVAEVDDQPCDCGGFGGLLPVGVSFDDGGYACIEQFRPIYRPKFDLIERLLEPIKIGEPA